MKTLKIAMVSMGIMLGMLMFQPQAQAGEPTLQQTMDWLKDFMMRHGRCERQNLSHTHTFKDSTTEFSFDAQKLELKCTSNSVQENNPKVYSKVTDFIPLYNIKSIKVSYAFECWHPDISATENFHEIENDYFFEDNSEEVPSIYLSSFKTKKEAERAAKALRHAAKLAKKIRPHDLF